MAKPTPYKGSEPYIFISYAHRDSERVLPVIARMQRDGYRVWYDEGIDPGTEWDDTIATHIVDCRYFIAILSANYLASDNCKDELNFVRDLNKGRLLLYLEDATLPAGMQMRLGRLQAIHWYTYQTEDEAFAKLYDADSIGACRTDAPLAEPAPPAPALPKEEQLFQAGLRLDAQQQYAQAAEQFRTAAELGHTDAQCYLAEYYACEDGGNDPAQAEKWYQTAAILGHPYAKYQISNLSIKDPKRITWLRKAAEQGFVPAQYSLGHRCEHDPVLKDLSEATHWYRKAAEQGHIAAQYRLSRCYHKGIGIAPDEEQAFYWLCQAALQGHPGAQGELGACYEFGRCVKPNLETALHWYRKAAMQHDFVAIRALKRLLE